MAADLRRKEKAATVLQTHTKGYLLRKQLRDIQKEYESVVSEIEGTATHILWPTNFHSIGLPLLITDPDELKAKLSTGKFAKLRNGNTKLEDTMMSDLDRTITAADDIGVDGSLLAKRVVDNKITDNNDASPCVERELFPSDEHIRGTEPASPITNQENNITNLKTQPLPVSMSTRDPSNTEADEAKATKVNVRNNVEVEHQSNNDHDNDEHDNNDSVAVIPLAAASERSGISSPVSSFSPIDGRHSTPALSERSETSTARRHGLKSHPLLTDSWMTDKSFDPALEESSFESSEDKTELHRVREQIAMELLWTHQAIESRKNYLRLKKNMDKDSQMSRNRRKPANDS